jgi:leader peptidase (prepilin peptidase)/N-methyltransferase
MMNYVLMFAFVVILILVTVVDIKKMEIPNTFVILIGIVGIVAMIFQSDLTFTNRLIGFFVISLPLLVITLIIPNAFGGGDIKLMAVSGFYLGVWLTLLSFFVGVIGGGIYGMWLLATRKKGKKEHFAFGPFLCAGMIIALFFGTQIIDWYLGMFAF